MHFSFIFLSLLTIPPPKKNSALRTLLCSHHPPLLHPGAALHEDLHLRDPAAQGNSSKTIRFGREMHTITTHHILCTQLVQARLTVPPQQVKPVNDLYAQVLLLLNNVAFNVQ